MGVLYEHWRPDTNECFYVGISWANENTRPHDLTPRNPHHGNVISKLKENNFEVDIRIQAWDLTKEELCELEVMQIAYWRDLIGDRLTNVAQGGEGFIQWTDDLLDQQSKKSKNLWLDSEYREKQAKTRQNPEFKKKASETQSKLKKGKPVPFLHTQEAVKKRAITQSINKKNKPIPQLNNDEVYKKKAETLKRLQIPAKPVINLVTGETFPSAKSASEYYNIPFEDYVAASCRKHARGGIRKIRPHGYHFAYILKKEKND